MMFMQQCKREICILSASGSISNASLRQPAASGGNIAYEVFLSSPSEIPSLSQCAKEKKMRIMLVAILDKFVKS